MNEGLPPANNIQAIEQNSDEEKLNVRFLKQKELVARRLAQKKERVDSALNKLESLKLELGSDDVENNSKLRAAYSTVLIREHAFLLEKNTEEFLRKPEQSDITYRLDIINNWPKKVAEVVPKDLPLRFHGCPIYTARAILSSGELSSSVDRLGWSTSYDASEQISVSTAENVHISTDSYTDLTAEGCCLPAGCVFVLLPKNEAEAKSGDVLLMDNISFTEEPNRLFAIVSTPENIARVSEWANAAGIPTDKVFDFSSFLSQFPNPEDSYKV
jgi:hypothetical protein